MKIIEIRRHSLRHRAAQDLSEEGISLARWIGKEMRRFDRVVASPLPRAVQTAEAMGFTVDEKVELLATTGDLVEVECPWPASFSDYAAAYRRGGATFVFARNLAAFYTNLADSLPEDGAALVVTHGGVVELSAVGCLPAFDFSTMGDYIEYCEGIRLRWENGQFIDVQVLRV
ncbi:MAG: histidine phosphatase family protein [Anaerolineales bacterium]|nr:histidine phosphatase family protein [Anaerolineales bacterium]